MVDKRKIFILECFFLGLLLVLFGIQLILAIPGAPLDLKFSNNVTANYDEGVFQVNWTANVTAPFNTSSNYTIYIYNGTTHYASVPNNSATGYSFSTTIEANYTFIIGATNGTGVMGTNSTNKSMYVDRTPPVITLPNYANATFKKNTTQLTLNISISDPGSGTTGTVCLVDVNGTNQSLAISNGWCNSTAVNLTGLIDGNQTIKVYVNDTVNNFGLNNSFVVQMDTAGPTISLSKSSSIRTSITVSFSCSDVITGVASCTLSSSSGTVSGNDISGLSCGTSYDITVSAEDNAGNSESATESFSTTSCGGGGTPSVSEWAKQKISSWTKITPGNVSIMKNFDKDIGIKEIQIEVNNPAQNVKITVSKYDGKPANVSISKSGKVYQYLQIETQNLESKLDKAIVTIKVEKNWTENNDITKENVALFKFNENLKQWDELTTNYAEEDLDNYYYNVELTSFSYFAISEKVAISAEAVVGETGEEEQPLIGEEETNLTWLWVLIAVVVLAIIIGGAKVLKKKR